MATENGQAQEAPHTMDDLAQFLQTENPDDGPADDEDEHADDGSDEDNPEDGDAESGESEDGDKPEDEDAPSQATQKIKVTVKGDDGADQTIEVDQKELVDGYLRRRDYTVKTQQLADRERQAVEVVTRQLDEGRNYFLEQAHIAKAAVLQLAGLKSPEEMAHLAVTNKDQWIEESQRSHVINTFLQQLDAVVAQHKEQARTQQQKTLDDLTTAAAGKLRGAGFDPQKLQTIFTAAGKKYGWTAQDFAGITDARLVLMMRDAVAYQALQEKKPEVQRQVQAKLPSAKQTVPKNEKVNRELNKTFNSGKANLKTLARFLQVNSN